MTTRTRIAIIGAGHSGICMGMQLKRAGIDDFLILEEPGALHVLNAPSPAATSSLEIGAEIARRLGT